MALVNKMKEIKDVKTFMSILDTISNSMDTNLTTKQILSFYNVGKDIIKKSLSSDDADLVNIQQLYLAGSGQMIYDERARMVLWDYIPNTYSRDDIVRVMKENLELESHSDIKEFHFSINSPYQKSVIGEGPYKSTTTYRLLPDFTGDTEETAKKTCAEYGLKCVIKGDKGTVVEQSEPFRKRIDLMKGDLVLTLSSELDKDKDKDDDDKDKDKDKDKDDDEDDDETGGNTPSPSPSPSPSTSPSPSPSPSPEESDDPDGE